MKAIWWFEENSIAGMARPGFNCTAPLGPQKGPVQPIGLGDGDEHPNSIRALCYSHYR
jgi:hypothetical protein